MQHPILDQIHPCVGHKGLWGCQPALKQQKVHTRTGEADILWSMVLISPYSFSGSWPYEPLYQISWDFPCVCLDRAPRGEALTGGAL